MRVARLIGTALAASSLAAQAHHAPHIAAEMKIEMISAACSSFEATYGFLPPQTNWFAELTASANSFLNRKKIVLLNATDIKDPWGRDLVCLIPGTHNTAGADVYSLGRDGRSSSGGNDPDDINNWNAARPWSQYYAGIHPGSQQIALVAGAVVLSLALYAVLRNRTKTEEVAPPSGGPATRLGGSGVQGGPPLVR
jgi:type II secretion system (T2SS) protein G